MSPEAWMISTVRGTPPEGFELPPARPLSDPARPMSSMDLESRSYEVPGRPRWSRCAGCSRPPGAASAFGQVERAKGLVRLPQGWFRLDVASGLVTRSPGGPCPGAAVVIGRSLDLDALARSVRPTVLVV